MLFKVAFAVLVAWFLGLVGVFDADGFTHVPLLVGLMLLLAALRARDAAVRRTGDRRADES